MPDPRRETLEKIGSRISAWISVALDGVEGDGEMIDPPLGEPVQGFVNGCHEILSDIDAALASPSEGESGCGGEGYIVGYPHTEGSECCPGCDDCAPSEPAGPEEPGLEEVLALPAEDWPDGRNLAQLALKAARKAVLKAHGKARDDRGVNKGCLGKSLRELKRLSTEVWCKTPDSSELLEPCGICDQHHGAGEKCWPTQPGEPVAWVQVSRHDGRHIAYGTTKDGLYRELQRLGYAITSGSQEPLFTKETVQ